MNNEVKKYIELLNEERTTNRLHQQLIREQEKELLQKENSWKEKENEWLQKERTWKERDRERLLREKRWKEKQRELEKQIRELQSEALSFDSDAKGYERDLEHSNKKLEEYEVMTKEYEVTIKALEKENEVLSQKLERETMTVKNLNSLIEFQSKRIDELSAQQNFKTNEKIASKSNSVSRSRATTHLSKQKYHQQSISESFSRHPSINNSQYDSQAPLPSSLSPSSSSQSIAGSQASTIHNTSRRSSPIEKSRSTKRPLEMDENDREAVNGPTTSTNNKMIRKSSRSSSFARSENTPAAIPLNSTTRNRIEQSDDVVDLSDNSSSPPSAAYYFEDELNQENSVIDLSHSIPSLESVIDHASSQNVTNQSDIKQESEQDQENRIPNVKHEVQEREEIADFTSLLTPTPRPALSDSTNNIPKRKNVILKTTNNANLLNNVASASNKRHQHGAGQTCKGCDKFYDTAPLRDVENDNALLSTKDRIQLHSKHRTRNDQRATTPPGFWDIDFTLSSQGVNK